MPTSMMIPNISYATNHAHNGNSTAQQHLSNNYLYGISLSDSMWEHLKRRSSYQALPLVESKRSNDLHKELQHPVLQSLRLVQMENQRGVSAVQTIVTLNKLISPQALHQCLRFIYTGTIDKECSNLQVTLILFS